MMDQTNTYSAGFVMKTLRSLFGALDLAVYSLLVVIYEVFFNVASAKIIEGATIKSFFGRIQIILGVFVLFKLAISLINVIVNPDQLGADKSGQGFSQIVVRVVISLVMLVAIMPLNIPGEFAEDSYEANLNANGLLFGTLYEFQDRILEQNTLAKLIIGSTKKNGEEERKNLKDTGRQLSTFILKGFIRINLAPGQTDEYESANWMCPDHEDDVKKYLETNISPGEVLDMLDLNCKTDDGKRFVFTYSFGVTTVVGVIFIIIMVGFIIDIAIRAFKLAVLRLIAPIPIISYIDPKSQKDGAFGSWVKAVTTTYLDLFLRLAVVFFVIFIIQDIMINGLNIDNEGGMIGAISWIFIILGLLYFAKQAPKFITTALGIKSMGLGVGLSGALGFMGGFVGGGGLGGAMTAAMTSANTASEAAAQGKAAPNAYSTGRDLIAKMKTGDEKATGGILNTAQRNMMMHSKRVIGAKQLQRRFGITASEAERSKNLMYEAQDYASDVANMRSDINLHGGDLRGYTSRDAAGNLHIDTTSNNGRLLEQFINTHQGDKTVKSWLDGDIDDATMLNYMVNKSQTDFQKQKKTYEDSDKMLTKYGNELTLEQKYGSNRYTARVRNTVAKGLQSNRVTRNVGERMENTGLGKGVWQRYTGDQGRARNDQDYKKYDDKNKRWSDRTR